MSDLSTVLPTKSATVEAIEAYWLKRGKSEEPRGYLGASSIGKSCSRELWYSFRKCSEPDFSGRLYRLFNRGHREEPTFVEELRGIGCEVHEFDSEGNQFEVIACEGHFKGHTDGGALGIPEAPKTWHLLEMKTSSKALFEKVKKNGVEKEKPQHFAQMQVYMHLTGLKRALYMVVNKDTDELYTERLRYDSTKARAMIDKASSIINATSPPERISEREDSWACKFCDAKALCHGSEIAVTVPALSCRQCVHASPVADGKWHCAVNGSDATKVCDQHLFLPGLVHFAEPTDSLTNKDGSAVIEFTSHDGTVWQHGPDRSAGQYDSNMLITLPTVTFLTGGDKKAEWTVETATRPNLEAKFSLKEEGVICIWKGPVEDVRGEFDSRYAVPMTNPSHTQEGNGWAAAEFCGQLCCVIIYGKTAEIRETNIPF